MTQMQQGMQQHVAPMQPLRAQPAAATTAAEHMKTMQAGVDVMQRMMTVLMQRAPVAAPNRTRR